MTYLIPNPGIYKQYQDQAQTAYDKSIASINSKRASYLGQQGYAGTFDPATQSYQNVHVDPNSLYGGFQQMRQQEGRMFDTAFNNASDRNIGHAGLGAQDESAARYQAGAMDKDFAANFQTGWQGFNQEADQASNQRTQSVNDAYMNAIQAAIQGGDFTPAAAAPSYTQPNDVLGNAPGLAAAMARAVTAAGGSPAKKTTSRKPAINPLQIGRRY